MLYGFNSMAAERKASLPRARASRTSYRACGGRGAVLIELGIALPPLVALAVLTVEIGLAIDAHQTLSAIAYETAREAASDFDLETGECEASRDSKSGLLPPCRDGAVNHPRHQKLHDKARWLMRDFAGWPESSLIFMSSTLDVRGTAAQDSVEINLHAVESGIGFVSVFPLRVRVRLPYLYERSLQTDDTPVKVMPEGNIDVYAE